MTAAAQKYFILKKPKYKVLPKEQIDRRFPRKGIK
jgi:hypothetical protein